MTFFSRRTSIVTAMAVLTLLFTILLVPHAFAADAVVGNGTPASCTEAAFDTALATVQGSGSGTITFNCGTAPHTINVSGYKQISSSVTIDGNNRINLDGANTSAFFQVFSDANLNLRRLTLQRGSFAGIHPLENFGTLTLDTVTVQQHETNGSVIANQAGGRLTLRNTQLLNNTFDGSSDSGGAGLYNDSGVVTIENSAFTNNSALNSSGDGGAIANMNGTVTITDTDFFTNSAVDRGGAIYATGTSTTTITGAQFRGNEAGYGGAVQVNAATARMYISESEFLENHAIFGDGGAVWILNGAVDIANSQFTSNVAETSGGAISCYGDSLNVNRSSFVDNNAGTDGGGIYTKCDVTLNNSTLTLNRATDGGGAVFEYTADFAYVSFTTIAENVADYGGGIYAEGMDNTELNIFGSIVAYNTVGNCDGVVVSNGYNFTNDMGCSAFTQTGDQQNANLPLSDVNNYGGPTLSRLPLPGNPAIDAIPVVMADGVAPRGAGPDQRGVMRPQGPQIDAGAVERTADDGATPTPTATGTPATATPTATGTPATPTPTATPNPNLTEKLYLPLILTGK